MATSFKYLQNTLRNVFSFKHVKHSRTKEDINSRTGEERESHGSSERRFVLYLGEGGTKTCREVDPK
jgi:hypothetical protein